MYNLKVLGAVGFRADDAAFDPGLVILVSTSIFDLVSICLVQQIQMGAIMKIIFFIEQLVSYKLIQLRGFSMGVVIPVFYYFPLFIKKAQPFQATLLI